MAKLLVLKGVPASGKSTFALKWVKEDPKKRIIVNRDSIRSGLGIYWIPSRESLISIYERGMVKIALCEGYDVCLDATNLNPNYQQQWIEIAEECDADIIYKEFTIPFWKCIFHDWKRGLFGGRKVGYKTIKTFYERYYKTE